MGDELTCSVPYVCSLSKLIRLGVNTLKTDNSYRSLKRMVIGIVEQFEADPELKASLKQKPEPGTKIMRQVDIREKPDSPIIFKVFVNWNWHMDMWHVFVEGVNESPFENRK